MGNLIGGTNPGEGNVIAGNGGIGVAINSWYGNAVRGNSIYANGALGIDLGSDGPDANDTGDPDTGPNNRQNSPILYGIIPNDGNSLIMGRFNSAESAPYALDFFASTRCDPTGFGEGQTYLGSVSTTTSISGNGAFTATVPSVLDGHFVSATLTDALR